MPDELQEIEQLAYKYMTAEEIAIIREIDISAILDRTHPFGKAFLKGKLLRKAAFNHAVIRLSDQLSSPAQAIELKISQSHDLGGICS